MIVPTRERANTLEHCLRTLTAQDYERATFLVSDNASSDSTAEVVRAARDPRVHYLNTGTRLSMAHNYAFALAHLPLRDGWVMLIGDDDGLVPGALSKAAGLIASTRAEAIRSESCSYAWPSLNGESFGRLGVPLGNLRELRASSEWIERVLRCEASYQDLPALYQGGLIKTSVLDEIHHRTGAFYRSCIPDVYSSFAIASVVREYLYVEEPLAINGLSGHSIGISQVRKGPDAKVPSTRFRAEGNIPFHPDIPLCADGEYPMGQAVVFECFLQSMPLRPPERQPRHAKQLELALATAPRAERAEVEAWGKDFARINALDFERIRTRARSRRVMVMGHTLPGLVRRATLTWAVGSLEQPIPDVFEASKVAGQVRARKISRARNVARLARRAVHRLAR